MMGPWLIYASLLNGAVIGLFEGSPLGEPFARFVAEARANMLGLVPSLVRAWRSSGALEGVDWSCVRRFSSTGEASHPGDMAWLMAQAGGVPVIEYCGGTEIGGGYLCGSMVQTQYAGQFSCPVMGCRFYLLDDAGDPANPGELALVSPMLGASQTLLNSDHEKVYFEGMPAGPKGERLRRHGDFLERLEGGYYRAHGRVDDTMNLGGIKVSSAEIERVVNRVEGLRESAAVALQPKGGGPSELVLVLVPEIAADDLLGAAAQRAIRSELNPLFKVSRWVFRSVLPRTASNKVMRRVLRAELEAELG
jgi:acetyl-CoA synthetase